MDIIGQKTDRHRDRQRDRRCVVRQGRTLSADITRSAVSNPVNGTGEDRWKAGMATIRVCRPRRPLWNEIYFPFVGGVVAVLPPHEPISLSQRNDIWCVPAWSGICQEASWDRAKDQTDLPFSPFPGTPPSQWRGRIFHSIPCNRKWRLDTRAGRNDHSPRRHIEPFSEDDRNRLGRGWPMRSIADRVHTCSLLIDKTVSVKTQTLTFPGRR